MNTHIVTGQLWSLSTTTLQVRLRVQLNSILFAKTLVRKDVASSAGSAPSTDESGEENAANAPNASTPPAATTDDADKKDGEEEDDFSSKAQIMTLMTTDVDRVSEFAWHIFTLFGMLRRFLDESTLSHGLLSRFIDSPVEILIGTLFLYNLLGVSCFFGLAVSCLFLPLNSFAGKVVVGAQDNLMKARDERAGLMNEVRIFVHYAPSYVTDVVGLSRYWEGYE